MMVCGRRSGQEPGRGRRGCFSLPLSLTDWNSPLSLSPPPLSTLPWFIGTCFSPAVDLVDGAMPPSQSCSTSQVFSLYPPSLEQSETLSFASSVCVSFARGQGGEVSLPGGDGRDGNTVGGV